MAADKPEATRTKVDGLCDLSEIFRLDGGVCFSPIPPEKHNLDAAFVAMNDKRDSAKRVDRIESVIAWAALVVFVAAAVFAYSLVAPYFVGVCA